MDTTSTGADAGTGMDTDATSTDANAVTTDTRKAGAKKQNLLIVVILVVLVALIAVVSVVNRGMTQAPGDGFALSITSGGETLREYTLEDIQAFPFSEAEKTISSGKQEDESGVFKGVPLEALLADVDPGWAEKYTEFVFHASDGFTAAVFLSDILKGENVIVVYEKDGQPLKSGDEGGKGPLRIVVVDDPFGNRSAYLLTSIEVQ
jgi:DMSO/TMAO reductase YedYZ molybdopterin-dependent catalytic subunit